jgi:hypothetical protein
MNEQDYPYGYQPTLTENTYANKWFTFTLENFYQQRALYEESLSALMEFKNTFEEDKWVLLKTFTMNGAFVSDHDSLDDITTHYTNLKSALETFEKDGWETRIEEDEVDVNTDVYDPYEEFVKRHSIYGKVNDVVKVEDSEEYKSLLENVKLCYEEMLRLEKLLQQDFSTLLQKHP